MANIERGGCGKIRPEITKMVSSPPSIEIHEWQPPMRAKANNIETVVKADGGSKAR